MGWRSLKQHTHLHAHTHTHTHTPSTKKLHSGQTNTSFTETTTSAALTIRTKWLVLKRMPKPASFEMDFFHWTESAGWWPPRNYYFAALLLCWAAGPLRQYQSQYNECQPHTTLPASGRGQRPPHGPQGGVFDPTMGRCGKFVMCTWSNSVGEPLVNFVLHCFLWAFPASSSKQFYCLMTKSKIWF